MQTRDSQPGFTTILKVICIVILALMLIAVLYAGWISVSYYDKIGV